MKKLIRALSLIFTILFIFLLTSTKIANAANANNFDDGISNWGSYTNPSAQFNTLSMGIKGLSLGYSFGLTQDTSGKVFQGHTSSDSDFLKPTVTTGSNSSYFSKINEFIDDNGTYRNALFQGQSNSSTVATQGVSFTSPDFMIVPSDNTSSKIYSSNFALLGSNFNNNGNTGLTNKKFYAANLGKDANGNDRYAYKIIGDFTRNENSDNNGTYNLQAEILLRPSPTNNAIVQRELYLYNPNNNSQKFTVLFGEDTSMKNGYSLPDSVPVYDLGSKRGVYVDSNGYNGHNYRLYVTNEVPDGFDSYTGQSKSGSAVNWVDAFSNKIVSGTGAETQNNPTGTQLSGFGDSAYTLKWSPTTLGPYQTAHYSSTFGVAASPVSVPTATKTYKNESRSDGTNHIGDKLKFTLKMINNGYSASWSYQKLTDEIPTGLQIDPNSIKQSSNGGTASSLVPGDYDSDQHTLTVYPNTTLTDQKYTTITFEASIVKSALNNLNSDGAITNKATFTGTDTGNGETSSKDFDASVDIPIQQPSFNYSFSKKVLNVTNGDTDYKTSVNAKKGDTVRFKLLYTVASSSKDTLVSGAKMTDNLPAGLEFTSSSKYAEVTGPDNYTYKDDFNDGGLGIGNVTQGTSVTVIFDAKVTASTAGKVTNTATVSGGTTSANETPGDMISDGADINIQNVDSITSTPSSIDFGAVNMYGESATLTNKSTVGELVVTHPDTNDFNVNVAYDNDNEGTKMKNNNNDSLSTDGSGLLFIKQRTNSATDKGTWTPLLPGGTPIQTESFKGNQQTLNLSNYVGVGDWKIKLAPETTVGTYHGTLTWTLSESV